MVVETSEPACVNSDSVQSRIDRFADQHGEAHLRLLYHAAFPLSLTPDLLYKLWLAIQKVDSSSASPIPWIAVSDILLSSFCDDVGHNLYEFESNVRHELLQRLRDDSRYGEARLKELADFVIAYVTTQTSCREPISTDLADTLRLGALAQLRPADAAHELAKAISYAQERDLEDLNRVAEIVQRLSEPLYEYQMLLTYARGMSRYARGDKQGATNYFQELLSGSCNPSVEGIALPFPDGLLLTLPKLEHSRSHVLGRSWYHYAAFPLLTSISFLGLRSSYSFRDRVSPSMLDQRASETNRESEIQVSSSDEPQSELPNSDFTSNLPAKLNDIVVAPKRISPVRLELPEAPSVQKPFVSQIVESPAPIDASELSTPDSYAQALNSILETEILVAEDTQPSSEDFRLESLSDTPESLESLSALELREVQSSFEEIELDEPSVLEPSTITADSSSFPQPSSTDTVEVRPSDESSAQELLSSITSTSDESDAILPSTDSILVERPSSETRSSESTSDNLDISSESSLQPEPELSEGSSTTAITQNAQLPQRETTQESVQRSGSSVVTTTSSSSDSNRVSASATATAGRASATAAADGTSSTSVASASGSTSASATSTSSRAIASVSTDGASTAAMSSSSGRASSSARSNSSQSREDFSRRTGEIDTLLQFTDELSAEIAVIRGMIDSLESDLSSAQTDVGIVLPQRFSESNREARARTKNRLSQRLSDTSRRIDSAERQFENSLRRMSIIQSGTLSQADLQRRDRIRRLHDEIAAELATLRGRRDVADQDVQEL